MPTQTKAVDSDAVLKTLAYPVRREILGWLKQPERHFSGQEHPLEMGVCAGQFERCGLSQSTVSAHLAILVRRLRENVELAAPDKASFYGGGAKGYVDYPSAA